MKNTTHPKLKPSTMRAIEKMRGATEPPLIEKRNPKPLNWRELSNLGMEIERADRHGQLSVGSKSKDGTEHQYEGIAEATNDGETLNILIPARNAIGISQAVTDLLFRDAADALDACAIHLPAEKIRAVRRIVKRLRKYELL